MGVVTVLRPSAGESGCRWAWLPGEARTTRPGVPEKPADIEAYAKRYGARHAATLKPYVPNPPVRLEEAGPVKLAVQDLLVGGGYAVAWREIPAGDGARTLYVGTGNSFPGRTAAADAAAGGAWKPVIRVFPAVPPDWADVRFHDLRADGAFLVSAERSGGRTRWVRIKSLAGEPCRIRPGFEGEIAVLAARPGALKPLGGGTYELDLRKGEEAVLYAGGQAPAARIAPLPRKPAERNPFGVHSPERAERGGARPKTAAGKERRSDAMS
jgi:hypothetical protein